MNVELFAAFLLAALVIQFTPGPGMLFIIAQGLTGGSRAGRAAACGAASGMLVHTCAVVLGLAAVLRAALALVTWAASWWAQGLNTPDRGMLSMLAEARTLDDLYPLGT
jgi:threonine/homoserine/homoserine lactone efflux protein